MKSFNGMLMTVVASGAMAASQMSLASVTQLPAPGTGLSQTNGNFEVYSLGFLDNLFGGTNFEQPSSPGQINDTIVLMSGAGGQVLLNPSGMDDAYETPSGTGGLPYFRTGVPAADFPDPAGDPSVDSATAWDADVSAIQSFFAANGGGELVFFFNLNETGGDDGVFLAFQQDELGWARVDLIDDQNPANNKVYFLSANDDPTTLADELALGLAASAVSGPDANTTTNPTGTTLPTLDPQWAYIHGEITVAADGSFLHYGPKTGSDPAGSSTVNQNLGANQAAFAMFNQELSDLVLGAGTIYDRISIDIRLSRINNGFEQAFILPGINVNQVQPIPEPWAVLTWVGLSAIGGAVAWRRRS